MELTGLSKDHNAADSELKIILSPRKKGKIQKIYFWDAKNSVHLRA